MKLLLTSGGLENETIITALKDLTGQPFEKLNLAFIPTAANAEGGDKWWLIKDLEVLKKLGFAVVDIVDISALPKEIWKKRLEKADVLFFSGGNVFHLMHWIKKSGLRELLPELLKTRVYVGVSAGSIVVCPSLMFVTFEKEAAEEVNGKVSEDGLKLVNFFIEPHANNPHFPELTFDAVLEESKRTSLPVYALDDQSAIKIVDGEIDVVSEGTWKKFN